MDITRNKFSNAVCIIFSAVLVGLFCVLIRNRLGLDNMVSCAIIAAVLCGIVACLIFFLNRIINKFSQGKALNDRLIYNIVIIVISLIFVVIRLLMISNVIEVPMNIGANYDRAVSNGGLYLNFSTVEGIVSTLISVFVSILGNTYFPIILVQFILNTASYVLILFGVKNLMGRMASLAACLGLAVGPVFYSSVASDGIENLILLMFGLIVFITSKYKKSMDEYQVKWFFSLFIGILLGLFGLYHKSLLVLPVIPVVVLWDCNSESTSTKVGNTLAMLAGGLITFFTAIVIDCFLMGNGGVDGFIATTINCFSSRFGFDFNLSVIERFVSMEWVLVILILCIAYCVLFWKNEDDAGHIMASFAILILAQMIFTVVGGTNIYPMLTLIALLSVGGYSFVNLGYDPDASDVYRIDDDMQPAVVQTIGNKVVASDEEIKNIFAENEEKMKAANAASETKDTNQTNEFAPNSAETTVVEDKASSVEVTNDTVVQEIVSEPVNTLEPSNVSQPLNIFESTNISEETKEIVNEEPFANASIDLTNNQDYESSIGGASKYSDPEERKTSDFGMKDSDFASLFDGSAIPPKFARGDMYDDWKYNEEENEENAVNMEENTENVAVTMDNAKAVPEITIDEVVPENTMDEALSDVSENNVAHEMAVSEGFSIFEETPVAEKNIAVTETVELNDSSSAEDTVKADDFGMNNTDFASLFSGSSIPPKFARNDLYDYEEELQSDEDSEDNSEIEQEITEENVEDNNAEVNEASDKKAYVDTFFSYLYDESVFEQPIEMREHKEPEEEKYVSNASKFADLDLDLGIDAFDNVPDADIESGEEIKAENDADNGISEESDAVVETVSIVSESESDETEINDEADINDEKEFEELVPEDSVTKSEEMTFIEGIATNVENDFSVETDRTDDNEFTEEITFGDDAGFAVENVTETEEISFDDENVAETEEISFDDENVAEAEELNFDNENVVETEELSFEIEDATETEELVFEVEDVPTTDEVIDEIEDPNETENLTETEEFKFGGDDVAESAIANDIYDEKVVIDESNIEEEFDFDEVIPKNNSYNAINSGWDSIDEHSLEVSLDKYEKSVEEEVFKALAEFGAPAVEEMSVEEAIERKIRAEEGFSYEEAISKRIEEEAIKEENGFSLEEAIEKKLEVEETIKSAEAKIGFSVEEALGQKLDLEESLGSIDSYNGISVEDVLSKKFEVEDALTNNTIDEGFSIQEAIEQKIDVEQEIDAAVNKPLLDAIDEFEAIDKELLNNEEALLIDEISFTPVEETVTDEISFASTEETVTDEISFAPVEETVTDEISFAPVEETVTDEISFAPVEETVTDEISFAPVEETVTDEISFAPVEETVTDEISFTPVEETVTEEISFTPAEETVAQETNFESADNIIEETSFELVDESATDDMGLEQSESVNEIKSIEEQMLEKIEAEEQTEVKKPVEFIENPLPLPKKHVHRELDYGRSVPENWMHYDVEVNSSNNFYDI